MALTKEDREVIAEMIDQVIVKATPNIALATRDRMAGNGSVFGPDNPPDDLIYKRQGQTYYSPSTGLWFQKAFGGRLMQIDPAVGRVLSGSGGPEGLIQTIGALTARVQELEAGGKG